MSSGHDVADARVHRQVAAMVRDGLAVEVWGLGDPASGPAGTWVRTRPRSGLARRALDAAVLPWRARGRVLMVVDPDMVVPALVRRRLPGRAARRLVVDVSEDYARLLRDRPWARGWRGAVGLRVAAAAAWGSARADVTVVADDHVPPLTARHRLVVRNLPDPAMLPAPKPREERPRAVYVGDVRGSRGLWAMLAAMELAPGWTLDVVGNVAAADADRLAEWQRTSAAADRVRFHGRMPPAEAWALVPGAWAGLSLLDPTPAFVDAIPSKLYEYEAVGLFIVVTDLPRLRAFVAERGGGAVVPTGTPDRVGAAVAASLQDLERRPEALGPVASARRTGGGDQQRAAADGDVLARDDGIAEYEQLAALCRP